MGVARGAGGGRLVVAGQAEGLMGPGLRVRERARETGEERRV